MKPRSAKPRVIRCPQCVASVRSDRIRSHLRSVHPSYRPKRDFLEKTREIDIHDKRSVRNRTTVTSFFTSRRIAGIVTVVVVIGVIAYALTRPPPPGITNGDHATDFTFTDMNGNSRTLSSYQGHPVLLWWIATWCSACGQDTSVFASSYYSQYRAAGVTVLELKLYGNLGESGPSLSTFESNNGYLGQAGWVFGAGDSSSSTNTYDPQGVTGTYFLLNSQGVILAHGLGDDSITGQFGSLLQQAQGQ